MDVLDRRLVSALQVNPRAAWGEIARAVGEHERTVARRLQRLIADGAVRVTAIYDDLRSGHGRPVHLHVQVRPGTAAAVAEALASRPDTRSVYSLTGVADIGCELVSPSREALHDILTAQVAAIDGVQQTRTQVVLHTFRTVAEWHAPYLDEREIAELRPAPHDGPQAGPRTGPHVDPHAGPRPDPHAGPHAGPRPDPHVDPHTGLHAGPHAGPQAGPHAAPHDGSPEDAAPEGGPASGSPPSAPDGYLPGGVPPDEEGLSPLEQEIADLLVADGRIAFTAIAERLGISLPTARRRAASLLERRLLLPRAEVEPALLGLEAEAQLWLKVRPQGLDHVGRTLSAHPHVRYCAATAGTHSLIVQVAVAHEAALYRFLTGVVGLYDEVTDIDVTLITRAHKRGHLRKSGLRTLERTP